MREKQDRKDEQISPLKKEKSKCFLIFYFIFISMGTADKKCCLYFHDLQSRDIPKASFPNGYTLLTWQVLYDSGWIQWSSFRKTHYFSSLSFKFISPWLVLFCAIILSYIWFPHPGAFDIFYGFCPIPTPFPKNPTTRLPHLHNHLPS